MIDAIHPKKIKSITVGKAAIGLGTVISLISGVNAYVFPRTEANQLEVQIKSVANHVEVVDSKYDKKIDAIRDDIQAVHKDIEKILMYEQRRANRGAL